jgi:glucose-6-phosphate 1-epimerase
MPRVLEPTARITAKYNRPFHLALVVRLTAHQLTTELHVKNTSSSDGLEFQALFHNYFRVPSSEVLIFPLQHQSYYDKTAATEEERSMLKEETRAGVDVKKYTDFMYENAPQDYEVTWPQGGIEIKTIELKDLVVWNPQDTGRKIADMEDGGW